MALTDSDNNGTDETTSLIDVASYPPQSDEQQSLVDAVYHKILTQIIQGKLRSGTELKSTRLAAELGVSRTPVIQAIGKLIAEGVVTKRMNMRAVVRPGAENLLVEVHDLRILLEPTAAALACRHMPDDVVEDVAATAASVAPNTDDKWRERARGFDFKLHLTIAEHTGNQPLRDAIFKCFQYKSLSYELGTDRADWGLRGYYEHLMIVDALKARDAATASAVMELHLRLAAAYRPEETIV